MWKPITLFVALFLVSTDSATGGVGSGNGSDINLCLTNNGGCGPNANCYGGIGDAPVVCVCFNGFSLLGGSCVAINSCATNNGGCDANAVCSSALGSYSVSCACKAGYAGNGWYCASTAPAVNQCATNNGGCDAHANCYGGVGGPSTCVCQPGYNQVGTACVATDGCATNNGGCDVNAICSTMSANRTVTCTCKTGFTGNGYYCQLPTGTSQSTGSGNSQPGTGNNGNWDCPSPAGSFWDWRYATPTCESLTVVYPAALPAGQANDCKVRLKADQGQVTLDFHNNTGCWSGTHTFYFHGHPNFPTHTSVYSVEWVRVAGTNCHWTANASADTVVCPQTHSQAQAASRSDATSSYQAGGTFYDWFFSAPTFSLTTSTIVMVIIRLLLTLILLPTCPSD